MALVPTVLAYLGCLLKWCADSRPAEGTGLLGAEEGGEGDGVDIAVGVLVGFVVAAG